jgi:hypothetical protein
MSGLRLKRLGIVMERESGNIQEIEGVLNPAVARPVVYPNDCVIVVAHNLPAY